MPDFDNASTSDMHDVARPKAKTRRGFRRLSLVIRTAEYDLIAKIAEEEQREPAQQAAFMLRRLLVELEAEAIKGVYREAEDRRASDDGPDYDVEEPAESGGLR